MSDFLAWGGRERDEEKEEWIGIEDRPSRYCLLLALCVALPFEPGVPRPSGAAAAAAVPSHAVVSAIKLPFLSWHLSKLCLSIPNTSPTNFNTHRTRPAQLEPRHIQTPKLQVTYLRNHRWTGQHCTGLSTTSGRCTRHSYCTRPSSSQSRARSIRRPSCVLRTLPSASSWAAADSRRVGKLGQGGAIELGGAGGVVVGGTERG